MNLFSYFRALQSKKKSAAVAKERLQIIVAHERSQRNPATLEYLPLLQQELLEVVRKYVAVRDEQIKIQMGKEGDYEILEVNITLPDAQQGKSKE